MKLREYIETLADRDLDNEVRFMYVDGVINPNLEVKAIETDVNAKVTYIRFRDYVEPVDDVSLEVQHQAKVLLADE